MSNSISSRRIRRKNTDPLPAEKRCGTCHEIKSLDCFTVHASKFTGYMLISSECKPCMAANSKRRHQSLRDLGLCAACGARKAQAGRAHCNQCNKTRLAYSKASKAKLKFEVLSHYSPGVLRCACCGETSLSLMTLDHVIPLGCRNGKKRRAGNNSYRTIRRQGFPDGYQVLCGGCNLAKSDGAECPHQAERRAMLAELAKLPMIY